MTRQDDLGIAVIGAGLVGPVTAMYLARRFGTVTVLEQHGDPRRNAARQGRSLMVILSVRGWRVLRELGLADRVRRFCMPLRARCGHLPGGGTHVTPYSRDGRPIWAVERERLLHVLLDAAEATPGVRIRFRQRIHDIDLDAPAVRLHDRWLPCQRIVGCDGARSVVRAAMVARGVREHVGTLRLAYQEINLSLALDRQTMHYWPTGDALFGAFPTAARDVFAGSVFFRLDGPAPSYASAVTAGELTEQFAATFPELTARIPDLADQLATKPIATIPLVRCDTWVWRDRVALAGDSCHAMAPFMGHGMNCAFEDARTLVGCLDDAGDWTAGLAAYERARKADADAIADISYEHYRTMSRLPDARNDDVTRDLTTRLTGLFPNRFVPLYERCSFTEESYASARENDRLLHELAHDLLRSHGAALLTVPDSQLREYALAH